MDIFCARLKEHRERFGWNQSELARRSGVPSQVISRLESGTRTGLTLDVARRLARALGVSLDALAGTWEDVEAHGPPEDVVAVEAAGAPAQPHSRGRRASTATRRRNRAPRTTRPS
jgi:transcriptional regulator with XRE-family HTH domain